MPPIRSLKDIKEILFEDLSIGEDIIYSFNKDDLKTLSSLYHSNNVSLLNKLVNKKSDK